jgi:hypothetical protein
MTMDEIYNNFMYHAPFGTQQQRYTELRDRARELAFLINADCPESRERQFAFEKLEEAIMWANASIARNEKP